jgi:hypothetical protein
MKEFFQEIVKAISNFKFYKEVKDFQLPKGIKYFLLLVLLVTIVLTIRYNYDFGKGLDIAIDWAKQNLPPIEIEDGVVKVDVDQPYKIIEEDFVLIIDTTDEIISLDGYKRGILLMRDKVIYKESEIKTETYDLSNIQSLRINENFMTAVRKNAPWIVLPIMFIALYIGFCISRFFQLLVFSIISVAISSIVDAKLTYRQLFLIGIYAITPSTILGAALAAFGIQLPSFLDFIFRIIYLIMGVINCKEPQIVATSQ